MRLFVIKIFLLCGLNCIGQDIVVDQLEYDNTPLKEVFFDLSKKFHVSISYSSDKVTLHKPINLNMGSTNLKSALSLISDQADLSFLIVGDQVVFKDKGRSGQSKTQLGSVQSKTEHDNSLKATSANVREPSQKSNVEQAPLASKDMDLEIAAAMEKIEPQKSQEVENVQISDKGAESSVEDFRAVLVPQEIHSLTNGLSGTQIVLSALGNSKRVFHNNTLKLHGFFREVILQDDHASWLVESIVDVLDPGYKDEYLSSNKTNEEVFISQTRSSFNYLYPEIVPNLESFNSLDAMLKWNPLKYPNDELQKRLLNDQYRIIDEFSVNGKDFIKIIYEEESTKRILKETYTIEKGIAIVKKYEKKIVAKDGYYLDNEFKLAGDKRLSFRLKEDVLYYEFESFQGKQYLSKAGGRGSADIYDNKAKQSAYTISIERFLDVYDVRRARIKRSGKGHMDKSKNLHLQLTKYDPGFWFEEEISERYPLDATYLRPLQREIPLERQFGMN